MTRASPIGVAVLGSTGSIGISTLDVLARHPDRFRVSALAAHANVELLYDQCRMHRPAYAALADSAAAAVLRTRFEEAGLPTQVLNGSEAIAELAAAPDSEYVMAAIVGAAGLQPALAAAQAGKRVLLANKEALVMSGELFIRALTAGRGQLIPIDSEHNAVFQCLPTGSTAGVRVAGIKRILLTASGGPFLRASLAEMEVATPEQACAHPRWSMGRKISVDSATLMNKGLELIEASILFGVPESSIEVVVHPQSIVHSMVEYLDGSVLAQLGNPDMRTPIAHALGCPERLSSGVESLDLTRVAKLEFEPPDERRFPSLQLARWAARVGGTAPAALNAANEEAVGAFLAGRVGFSGIVRTIERTLDRHVVAAVESLEDVMTADRWARDFAKAVLTEQAA